MCNKKVTHTWTICNATGYSMYTWKASPTEAPTSVAGGCHACQNNSMMVSFLSQIKPLLWQSFRIHHGCSNVTRRFWSTVFRHKTEIMTNLPSSVTKVVPSCKCRSLLVILVNQTFLISVDKKHPFQQIMAPLQQIICRWRCVIFRPWYWTGK
jgi:hypothetical protein